MDIRGLRQILLEDQLDARKRNEVLNQIYDLEERMRTDAANLSGGLVVNVGGNSDLQVNRALASHLTLNVGGESHAQLNEYRGLDFK